MADYEIMAAVLRGKSMIESKLISVLRNREQTESEGSTTSDASSVYSRAHATLYSTILIRRLVSRSIAYLGKLIRFGLRIS